MFFVKLFILKHLYLLQGVSYAVKEEDVDDNVDKAGKMTLKVVSLKDKTKQRLRRADDTPE